jgi:hypothetical protein
MSMDTRLSHHARVRMQQRGVRPELVQWLLQFGSRDYDGKGGQIRYFDDRARRRLFGEIDAEAMRRVRDHLDSYAVVANDGKVVTVGHRYRRRWRR